MLRQRKQRKGRHAQRLRRHRRIRKRIRGSGSRPRLVVFRSLRNIEGQIVDDDAGRTLVGLSTLSVDGSDVGGEESDSPGLARARAAGRKLAEKAAESGVKQVVFDRGGYKYHGRVKAFAEGARAGGLEF